MVLDRLKKYIHDLSVWVGIPIKNPPPWGCSDTDFLPLKGRRQIHLTLWKHKYLHIHKSSKTCTFTSPQKGISVLQRRGLFPCLMSSCYITNVRANTHHSSRIRFWFVAVCFLNICKSQQCMWTQEAELHFQPWWCGQGDSCSRCACVHAAGWCTAPVYTCTTAP